MNFLFASNASSNAIHPTIGLDKQGVASAASTTHSTPMQDIELVIDIDSSFHGVLLGLPEESPGAVLNATAILHVRKKPIKASKLTATFDGRIKVQCSDGATFGPEQYRERVLAHKDWILWEAGGNNTHSGSKNHIPVGTHYYPLSIQLDGALPPTFSGKHGSIRYILSTSLLRPIFHSDINTVQEIEIKRCLVSESSESSTIPSHETPLDLGSLLVNQLSRAGISSSSNEADPLATPAEQPLGPTTITHHNTYKESLRYTATSPPIAHLEGGLIYVDLALEPLPPGSYIYSIAYGLKESIYYRSSATGNLADNKSEILYPIGQQTVIVPRDQERERTMASAGAGASTRQLLELRPCPLLTNVDITTPLIEIQHRITCNVAIVLPDSSKRCNSTSPGNGEQSSGRLLRRLNLVSQPQAPNLNLVDSSGTEATNNAVLLGEPTHSIIEPALVPANIELNGAPPPPPPSQLETIMLEFPIILTSRYPSSPRPSYPTSMSTTTPISFPTEHSAEGISHGNGEECAYQALAGNSYSSQLASSLSLAPTLSDNEPSAQFVHNREICPTIIPTTGTTVPSLTSLPMSTETISASPSSSCSSSPGQGPDSGFSSSTLPSHISPLEAPDSRDSYASFSAAVVRDAPTSTRALMQSGISAGLRAAAAAAASSATTAPANESTPISPPPSYGRQARSAPTTAVPEPRPEELPKYEDVVDSSNTVLSFSPGITIPTTTPIPMPMQVPSRSSYSQSVATRLMARSSSPGQVFSASPPLMSSASPPNDGFEQGSSPRSIRTRSGSTTSVLHSTSLARSPGQSLSSVMSMTPIQQHQAHVQAQFQRQHQRQRSGGVATIIGSLGCNGGYLSQQPAPLCMPDLAGTPSSFHGRNASPPAYAYRDTIDIRL
ncbi:hypothetical protein BGX34_003610 [Mortierella sp. NVP85]|nr:hypothetical protein BGX34_003610 [Mortierella sp. NVP85]